MPPRSAGRNKPRETKNRRPRERPFEGTAATLKPTAELAAGQSGQRPASATRFQFGLLEESALAVLEKED